MKHLVRAISLFAVLTVTAHAQQLVYLRCDLPAKGDVPSMHLRLMLDEAMGTVSYVVKGVNTTNTIKAVFGPNMVSWTEESKDVKIFRSISRITLSFSEVNVISGKRIEEQGTCSLTNPPERKF